MCVVARPIVDVQELRRKELGRFFFARREELRPEAVGLASQGRRRVRGLRRHEVADLAGVSVTWYTWLEQGRDFHISASMLDAVCRTLGLDSVAWRYVRSLAEIPVPDPRPTPPSVSADLVAFVDDQLPNPAALMTAAFDFVAWNESYAALCGDPGQLPEEWRNALWALFVMPEIAKLMIDIGSEAPSVVARFQAEYGQQPDDPRFNALVVELSERSKDFRAAWERCEVAQFTSHLRTFDHPAVGVFQARQLLLTPIDHPGLLLVVHRPTDAESRKKLERLQEKGSY